MITRETHTWPELPPEPPAPDPLLQAAAPPPGDLLLAARPDLRQEQVPGVVAVQAYRRYLVLAPDPAVGSTRPGGRRGGGGGLLLLH
jgi:hypothetical protein